MRTACGIDFGTSNSTVAVARGGAASLVALEQGKTTLPSAVFFKPGAQALFGRAAIGAYMDGEEGRLLRGLKKILGTALMDDKTMIGNRAVPFTDILKRFVGHLKDGAESFADTPIENAVLGRPVHFHDGKPDADRASQATLEAVAKDAGFKAVEFLYEPIAAAFAHEAEISGEKLSLVIDLGGGTSDFTVIRLSNSRMNNPDRKGDILATSGVRVGGTTFDSRLSMKSFMPYLGLGGEYHDTFDHDKWLPISSRVYFDLSDWALVNYAQTRKAVSDTETLMRCANEPDKIGHLLTLQEHQLGHALLQQVEAAKIALTDAEKHAACLKELDPELIFRTTRKQFEGAIKEDVAKVSASITECLSAAGIVEKQVELVILTGGSTELPVINGMVRKRFPHAAISQGNKLDSVGLGLAYYAANAFR